MGTLRDLLTGAMRLINVVGQGTPLDPNMLTNGLYALDTMTDSWSNERLMVYSIKPYIFSTVPGKNVYTMGPANDSPGAVTQIALPALVPGVGYTDGTYSNVPAIYAELTITGSLTHLTFTPGETMTQVASTATAVVISSTPTSILVLANSIVGTPDAIHQWQGMSSSADFTPTTVPTITGTGTGLTVNVVINEGSVIDVQMVEGGENYLVSDLLTVATANLAGSPSTYCQFQPLAVTPQTDWVITRPMMIEEAYTIWNDPLSAQAVDIPITILTMEQYASISVKNTPSTFAFALYDDNSWPVRNITFFPIPTNNVAIRFWLRQPLIDADYSMLDEPVDFPPGYERAFRYNLAVELAPEYGKAVAPEVARNAAESKLLLKNLNQKPMFKRGDGGLTSRNQGYFNWITGDFYNWRQ